MRSVLTMLCDGGALTSLQNCGGGKSCVGIVLIALIQIKQMFGNMLPSSINLKAVPGFKTWRKIANSPLNSTLPAIISWRVELHDQKLESNPEQIMAIALSAIVWGPCNPHHWGVEGFGMDTFSFACWHSQSLSRQWLLSNPFCRLQLLIWALVLLGFTWFSLRLNSCDDVGILNLSKKVGTSPDDNRTILALKDFLWKVVLLHKIVCSNHVSLQLNAWPLPGTLEQQKEGPCAWSRVLDWDYKHIDMYWSEVWWDKNKHYYGHIKELSGIACDTRLDAMQVGKCT
jgi:hypothetical protein